MTKITTEFGFAATAAAISKALVDEVEFERFTGMSAKISPAEGGAVSLFSGYVKGCFIKLKQNERLIMAWKNCYNWKEGEYSILNLSLSESASKTVLKWHQEGIPEREVEHMSKGVVRKYITPVQSYLSAGVPAAAC